MEEQRFDELTRVLAQPTSRRQMLKVLGAAVFGGWAATRGAPSVLATGNCANQGNSCAAEKCCQGLICVATTTSNSTQKFCCDSTLNPPCGKTCCPTGALCNASNQCVCPTGKKVCTTTTNPFGACLECCGDADCGTGFVCQSGLCVACGGAGQPCCSGGICAAGQCCTTPGQCAYVGQCCLENDSPCTFDAECCTNNCNIFHFCS